MTGWQKTLNDEPALNRLAIRFAHAIQTNHMQFMANHQPILLLLDGDLGAGKTTFIRAFIRALMGEDVMVKSPTYEIFTQYQTQQILIQHADFYRLDQLETLEQVGWFDAFNPGVIQLVEWAKRIPFWENLPRINIEIKIIDLNHRTIAINSFYDRKTFSLDFLRNEHI